MGMVFALVLFGCSDDGSACQRLSTQPEHYVSRTLCEADQDTALQSEIALRSDYPAVISRCLQARAGSAMARGTQNPTPLERNDAKAIRFAMSQRAKRR